MNFSVYEDKESFRPSAVLICYIVSVEMQAQHQRSLPSADGHTSAPKSSLLTVVAGYFDVRITHNLPELSYCCECLSVPQQAWLRFTARQAKKKWLSRSDIPRSEQEKPGHGTTD